VISPTVIEVTINISPTAPVGSRIITVTNPDGRTGTSKAGAFRVTTDFYPKPTPVPKAETSAYPWWNLYE
jgi:hypothetical protein